MRKVGGLLCAGIGALLPACTGWVLPSSEGYTPGPPKPGPVLTPPTPPLVIPDTSGARRLTSVEYDNTVADLLGDTTRSGALSLPASVRNPFDNDYTLQVPSEALIDGAERLATDMADRLAADPVRRSQRVGCAPKSPSDEACFRQFVATFGRLALRRTLEGEEVNRFMALQAFAADAGDFYVGVDLAIRAMLQDPRFLYRIEMGAPDAGTPGIRALDGPELATRLSYLLWGSTPDVALLDAAESGQLASPDQVRAAAGRMLADPRAEPWVERFHALWLGYEDIALDPSLAVPMRAESDALVRRVVFDDRRAWHDLLQLDQTFIPDSLAQLYGLPLHGSQAPAWVSYGSSGRLGILSQGSFLALGIRFGDTSPTQRGLAVRNRLLCQDVPPPPPGVPTDQPVPPTPTSVCKVDRYQAHAAGGCAACHGLMDPVGFGLENYDSEGRFRTHDDGQPQCLISGQGNLQDGGAFQGPGGLGALLATSDAFHHCAAMQLYRFAMGRAQLDEIDVKDVDALAARLTSSEPRLDDLFLDLVSSNAFRSVDDRGN
jgi:hypothetical protein